MFLVKQYNIFSMQANYPFNIITFRDLYVEIEHIFKRRVFLSFDALVRR